MTLALQMILASEKILFNIISKSFVTNDNVRQSFAW